MPSRRFGKFGEKTEVQKMISEAVQSIFKELLRIRKLERNGSQIVGK